MAATPTRTAKTINMFFASGVVVPGTGIIMGDDMDDFNVKPGALNSIEPGKRADLVLFDTERPEWQALFNPVNNLVYNADGRSVHTVVVDGRVVVEDHRQSFVDEVRLFGKVQDPPKNLEQWMITYQILPLALFEKALKKTSHHRAGAFMVINDELLKGLHLPAIHAGFDFRHGIFAAEIDGSKAADLLETVAAKELERTADAVTGTDDFMK